ncbi:probable ATP-dependent RNA helicase vasa-like isoform X2 [Scylla paramamosain]|uniref:probable ATP-dependent RNA helicase vasa-like isoform X2 n=1 Tax=Scylla paramamosain TaxID=85552 RepID=UPI003083609E
MDEDWETGEAAVSVASASDAQIPEFLKNSSVSFFSNAGVGRGGGGFDTTDDPFAAFGNSSNGQSSGFGGGGVVMSFDDDLPSSSFGDNNGFGGDSRGRGQGRGRGRGRGRGGGDGGGGGRGGGSCYNCGEEGHISRNCPKEKTNSRRNKSDGDSFGGGFGTLDSKGTGGKTEEPERPPPLFCPKEVEESMLFDLGVKTGVNFEAYDKIPMKVTGEEPIPPPVTTFQEMNLRNVLLENVSKAEFPRPTPIQKYSIPILMNQRDLMACAQTGSGKTAAFLLPMLHYILENDIESHSFEDVAQPVGLVLAPTRELAIQIFQEARKFSLQTVIKNSCIYGGVATNFQLRRMKEQGCHIIIATPGKLLFFLGMGKISLKSLKFLVFDEADRMLDLGFIDDMEKLVAHPDMPPKGERLTMMFSATFPEEVQRCALRFLDNYLFLVAGQVGAANKDVCQTIVQVAKFEKRDKLAEYLRSFEDSQEKVLVFVEMKRQADFVGTYLSTNGFRSVTLHGGRYQEQREEALSAFRSNQYRVLVATSVAARGLDIRGVGYVINYDLPKSADEYVHRIGRTGRVGNRGQAVSFYDPEQDLNLAKDLVRILTDAEQEVPSWLRSAADGGGGATYSGSGQFASTDIRNQNDGFEASGGWSHLGGPVAQEDDDVWDD